MKVVMVASSEKIVEIAAACFTLITNGISDIDTRPKPNPVRPCTNPAQTSASARNGQCIRPDAI